MVYPPAGYLGQVKRPAFLDAGGVAAVELVQDVGWICLTHVVPGADAPADPSAVEIPPGTVDD